jgi:hypothetical protein
MGRRVDGSNASCAMQMLICFVSFLAGSIYALVRSLCCFVLFCSCMPCAAHNSTSGVTSGPLRSNTSNKDNKWSFAWRVASLDRSHTRSRAV